MRGLGPVREYGEIKPEGEEPTITGGDAYDLYLQLLAQQNEFGNMLRKVVAELKKDGLGLRLRASQYAFHTSGTAKTLRKNRNCTFNGGSVKCDVESVSFTLLFTGPVKTPHGPTDGDILVDIEFLVYRDAATRMILEYKLIRLEVKENGSRGGTASTSGGR